MRALRLSVLLFLVASAAQAAPLPSVESFSPQGVVKKVRQVVVRFSEPMVGLGDPRVTDPFGADCPVPGQGHWADSRHWTYDFSQDLPSGLRCRFTLKAITRTLAGRAVAGQRTFEFSTGGPSVVHLLPWAGSGQIDEEQLFIVGFDTPIDAASLTAHGYCQIDGIAETVPVRRLEGEERRAVLQHREDFLNYYTEQRFGSRPDPAHPETQSAELTQFLNDRDRGNSEVQVLACQRRFPNGAKVQLVFDAGVATATGVAGAAPQRYEYQVREEFRARFSCERVNKDAHCIPVLPLSLRFTAPIARADAERIGLKDAAGRSYAPKFSDDGPNAPLEYLEFPGPFPERQRFTLSLPPDLKDDAGRALANQSNFPLTVATDEDPPLAKFAASFGIIEAAGDAALPVTIRNLEPAFANAAVGNTPAAGAVGGRLLRIENVDARSVLTWQRKVEASREWVWDYDETKQENVATHKPGQTSVFDGTHPTQPLALPRPDASRALEVIGIPLKTPGFYVVEIASPRLGAALLGGTEPYFVPAAALVTNLSVHFKWGRESSLVWVTRLNDGAPAADAAVRVEDCAGTARWEGKTDAQGLARVTTALPQRNQLPDCKDLPANALYVTARLGDDTGFVSSEWNEGLAPWRFGLSTARWDAPKLVSSVLDRSLLRGGETLHMKHYFRKHHAGGLAFAAPDELPQKLRIQHEGSEQKYEFPLQWDASGTSESVWQIPSDAKQGFYTLRLIDKDETAHDAGRVRVEAFRVPTMKALLQPVQAALVQTPALDLDIQLNYLAGGGAGHAAVKLRGVVQARPVSYPQYPGFRFAAGDVVATQAEGESEDESPKVQTLATQALTLDGTGGVRAHMDGIGLADKPQEVSAEVEFQDTTGERLTTAARIPWWPAQVVLGLKPDGWAANRDEVKFQVLALDLEGRPQPAAAVNVDFLQRQVYSHRKRLVGGYYAYEHHREVKALGAACSGTTDAQGLLSCTVKPPASGNLVLRATAQDGDGRKAFTSHDVWVAGSDEWWFEVSDNDRMDLLPEAARYEPGASAKLQVRMPFREATALVTIEREGILDTYVQTLSGKAPFVEIPMKEHYAPNVFVSVLAVRGRAHDVQPTALIDLGRPAFKLGVAELKVGWRAHELKVDVASARERYKVREPAEATVTVARADGGKLPEGAELAVAVVDEGLLELMPNASWKLLDAMMRQRGLEVETATAQMQVVGKRHYGRKAVPAGGGGGRQPTRELFDTLIHWQGRVPVDTEGRAKIGFKLNDTLTALRVVAVGHAGAALFGTGSTTIRSTQDLMLLPAVPPVVRSGDRLRAGVTVRNASERAMQVAVEPSVAPAGLAAGQSVTRDLRPGAAEALTWEITVPENVDTLQWEVAAKELAGGGATDRLHVQQRVIPAVPEQILQATLTQLEPQAVIPVQPTAAAIRGRGGLHIDLAARLGADQDGLKRYWQDYPYSCLEQKVSKAVALQDDRAWKTLTNELAAYLDADGLAKFFPDMNEGSEILTAYLLAIAKESGRDWPGAELERMRSGLKSYVTGSLRRLSSVAAADLPLRKLAVLAALARYEEGGVDPQWLQSLNIEPALWPSSAVLDWWAILQNSPRVPERAARLTEVHQQLRAQLHFSGTTLNLSGDESLWYLLVSPDLSAARLLTMALNDPAWREDLPRLARGVMGRQRHGHWDTTLANAWGALAMRRFAQVFEATPVAGHTRATLSGATTVSGWNNNSAAPLQVPWPQAAGELTLVHEGGGKPWASVQSRAAIPLKKAYASGYAIKKSITAVEGKTAGRSSVGDVLKVRLEVDAQTDMTWVVVSDPIPAGSTLLGSGLGGDSKILSAAADRGDTLWPAFQERTFDSFRAYYAWVPKGRFSIEYTLRLNTAGVLQMPPTRVEAMYAPELMGLLPNPALTVDPD